MFQLMNDTAKLIAAIATVWDELRRRVPDLPEVTVAIDTTGARHDLGYPEEEGKVTGVAMAPELPVHVDTIREGAEAVIEHVIHVATHALCRVRGVPETSNRGRRHNRRFAMMAIEVGGRWPDGQAPHAVKGYSPVPVSDRCREDMAPYVSVMNKVISEAKAAVDDLSQGPKTRQWSRVNLTCGCEPGRKIQMPPTVAALGPVICGVCNTQFLER